jgi:hypothetical protein
MISMLGRAAKVACRSASALKRLVRPRWLRSVAAVALAAQERYRTGVAARAVEYYQAQSASQFWL